MVQIKTEIEKKVAANAVTKIIGQPTNSGIDLLEEELLAIAASITTPLGGGNNGHAGILMEDAEYLATFGVATVFTAPANPGVYPAGPFPAGSRKEREAEHEKEIEVYETYLGVAEGLKSLIRQAVDEDYILELRAEKIGYLRVTAKEMLTHLRTRWGSADFVDKCALLNELNAPWNVAEVPTVYFNRVEKATKQLARVNVPWPMEASMNSTLKAFKDCGDYDAPVREWEAKPEINKTWDNLKIMISNEYSKFHRQHTSTAKSTGYGSANALEDYVTITEELVANISEENEKKLQTHVQWLESLNKANSNMLKSIMVLLEKSGTSAAAPAMSAGGSKHDRQQKRTEYKKRLEAATPCVHCKKKHPNRADDKCWELDTNAASCPAGWKLVKATVA